MVPIQFTGFAWQEQRKVPLRRQPALRYMLASFAVCSGAAGRAAECPPLEAVPRPAGSGQPGLLPLPLLVRQGRRARSGACGMAGRGALAAVGLALAGGLLALARAAPLEEEAAAALDGARFGWRNLSCPACKALFTAVDAAMEVSGAGGPARGGRRREPREGAGPLLGALRALES
ncbi:UNVERIFIED_CONTAM: hypothetical protein K2H54_073843 [Gekko kuhli]